MGSTVSSNHKCIQAHEYVLYIYIFVWELPRLPIELQWLKGAKPDFALKQTAHYFMDLLSPEEHTTLKEICNVWNSAAKPFTVGTTCSGLETGGLVVEKTFEALNERFGISLQSKVAFAVELHEVLWLKNNNHNGIVQPFSMDKFYVRSFQLLLRLRQLCPEPLTAGFRIDLKNQKVSCPFFVSPRNLIIYVVLTPMSRRRGTSFKGLTLARLTTYLLMSEMWQKEQHTVIFMVVTVPSHGLT